jgi:hypothetical protein
MSLEVRVWAMNRSWGSPLHRFVALTIADLVSPHNDCIVSLDHISESTEIPKEDVQEILSSLANTGSLCVTPAREAGRYEMIFPECEDLCNPVHPPSERQVFRARIVEAFERKCVHCGREGAELDGPDGRTWTIDRLIPGSIGGTYRLSNVALSCFTCNVQRGNRLLNQSVQSLEDREKGKAPWRGWRRRSVKAKLPSKRRPRERRVDGLKSSG